jgi:hypothetical protein
VVVVCRFHLRLAALDIRVTYYSSMPYLKGMPPGILLSVVGMFFTLTHTYTYTHAHSHPRTHIHTHTHTQTHTYTHMRTYTNTKFTCIHRLYREPSVTSQRSFSCQRSYARRSSSCMIKRSPIAPRSVQLLFLAATVTFVHAYLRLLPFFQSATCCILCPPLPLA